MKIQTARSPFFVVFILSVTLLVLEGCRTSPKRPSQEQQFQQAEAHLRTNQLNQAREIYLRMLSINPKNSRASLGLARVALKHGDYTGAIGPLERALGTGFLTPEERGFARIQLGRAYYHSGRSAARAWEYLFPAWSQGDRTLKESLDGEMKEIARQLPRSTAGVTEVLNFNALKKVAPIQAGPVAIFPRSAWSPLPMKTHKLKALGTPTRITIHHSAQPLKVVAAYSSSRKQVAQLIHNIQSAHIKSKGWIDIAYHYIIGPRGEIWEGRPIKYMGAHAGGPHGRNNVKNIGIVVLGNFCTGHQKPSTFQVQSVKKLTSWLCKKYGIKKSRIYGHRDLKATKCPGDHLYEVVKEMRRGR